MKTREQIIEEQAARKAGRIASESGQTFDKNPHPEDSDLHWQWLDAWSVSETAKTINRYPDKAGIPFLR